MQPPDRFPRIVRSIAAVEVADPSRERQSRLTGYGVVCDLPAVLKGLAAGSCLKAVNRPSGNPSTTAVSAAMRVAAFGISAMFGIAGYQYLMYRAGSGRHWPGFIGPTSSHFPHGQIPSGGYLMLLNLSTLRCSDLSKKNRNPPCSSKYSEKRRKLVKVSTHLILRQIRLQPSVGQHLIQASTTCCLASSRPTPSGVWCGHRLPRA